MVPCFACDVAPVAAEIAPAPDPTFPGGGTVGTSIATGVPFLAMGEVAVGIGRRVALAAIGGATPVVPGFGVRPRLSVLEIGSVRAVLAAPVLYYPFTPGRRDGAWVLGRPSLVVELAVARGTRVGLGGGVVVASALGDDGIVGYGEERAGAAWWNTLNVTFATPLGASSSLFAEGALVMRGLRIAGDEWVGGPPFTVALGVATNLL